MVPFSQLPMFFMSESSQKGSWESMVPSPRGLGLSRPVSKNPLESPENQPTGAGFHVATGPVQLRTSPGLAAGWWAPTSSTERAGSAPWGWFPGIAARGLSQLGVASGCGLALCPSRGLGALAWPSGPPQSPSGEGANGDRWAVGGPSMTSSSDREYLCLSSAPPRPPAHCGCGAEMQARSPDSSGETRSAGAGSRLRACQTSALRSFLWRKGRGVGWGALSANCPALEDS